MRIYDISQELFSSNIYSGDPKPEKKTISNMENGDLYNLTTISMCAHNGTHIDAPLHFIKNGKSVDEIPLEKFIGNCRVIKFDGEMNEAHAKEIINACNGILRVLFKGNAVILPDAAKTFAEAKFYLVGVESQSVGPLDAPMEVHKILLNEEVVILEGIRLLDVAEGEYILCAQPLKTGSLEGAPCRAVLIDSLN